MYFYVMTRKRWEKLPEDLRPSAEEIIRDCVNFLLVSLYRPDGELPMNGWTGLWAIRGR